MSEEKIQTVMTAEDFATEISAIVFNNSKAKICNLLETVMPQSQQLFAARRVAEDIISTVSKTAHDFVIDVLGENWEQTVGCGEITVTTDIKADYDTLDEIVKKVSKRIAREARI